MFVTQKDDRNNTEVVQIWLKYYKITKPTNKVYTFSLRTSSSHSNAETSAQATYRLSVSDGSTMIWKAWLSVSWTLKYTITLHMECSRINIFVYFVTQQVTVLDYKRNIHMLFLFQPALFQSNSRSGQTPRENYWELLWRKFSRPDALPVAQSRATQQSQNTACWCIK